MLDKTKRSFTSGLTRVRWMATFLAERTREETSIAKRFYQRSKLEQKIDDLYRDIGKRVAELKEEGETNVFNDSGIQLSLAELKDKKETLAINKTPPDDAGKMRE